MLLDKISKMDSGVIRGLCVAAVAFAGTTVQLFGVTPAAWAIWKAKIDGEIDAILVLVTALGLAKAAYSRLYQPTPPLTDSAIAKRDAAVADGTLQTRPPPSQPSSTAQSTGDATHVN